MVLMEGEALLNDASGEPRGCAAPSCLCCLSSFLFLFLHQAWAEVSRGFKDPGLGAFRSGMHRSGTLRPARPPAKHVPCSHHPV